MIRPRTRATFGLLRNGGGGGGVGGEAKVVKVIRKIIDALLHGGGGGGAAAAVLRGNNLGDENRKNEGERGEVFEEKGKQSMGRQNEVMPRGSIWWCKWDP